MPGTQAPGAAGAGGGGVRGGEDGQRLPWSLSAGQPEKGCEGASSPITPSPVPRCHRGM